MKRESQQDQHCVYAYWFHQVLLNLYYPSIVIWARRQDSAKTGNLILACEAVRNLQRYARPITIVEERFLIRKGQGGSCGFKNEQWS